jgi:hypothetical protein
LAFEGIGGEVDAVAGLVFEEGGPIGGCAGFPEIAECGEDVGEIVGGGWKRGDDGVLIAGWVLACELGEGLAWADFEEDEVFLC